MDIASVYTGVKKVHICPVYTKIKKIDTDLAYTKVKKVDIDPVHIEFKIDQVYTSIYKYITVWWSLLVIRGESLLTLCRKWN